MWTLFFCSWCSSGDFFLQCAEELTLPYCLRIYFVTLYMRPLHELCSSVGRTYNAIYIPCRILWKQVKVALSRNGSANNARKISHVMLLIIERCRAFGRQTKKPPFARRAEADDGTSAPSGSEPFRTLRTGLFALYRFIDFRDFKCVYQFIFQ